MLFRGHLVDKKFKSHKNKMYKKAKSFWSYRNNKTEEKEGIKMIETQNKILNSYIF
jgi:hypothetical protein